MISAATGDRSAGPGRGLAPRRRRGATAKVHEQDDRHRRTHCRRVVQRHLDLWGVGPATNGTNQLLHHRCAIARLRIGFRHLPLHRWRLRRHTPVYLRLVETKDFGTTFFEPGLAIANRLAVRENERIGQRVGADLRFVVVRDVAGLQRAAQWIAVGVVTEIGGRGRRRCRLSGWRRRALRRRLLSADRQRDPDQRCRHHSHLRSLLRLHQHLASLLR